MMSDLTNERVGRAIGGEPTITYDLVLENGEVLYSVTDPVLNAMPLAARNLEWDKRVEWDDYLTDDAANYRVLRWLVEQNALETIEYVGECDWRCYCVRDGNEKCASKGKDLRTAICEAAVWVGGRETE